MFLFGSTQHNGSSVIFIWRLVAKGLGSLATQKWWSGKCINLFGAPLRNLTVVLVPIFADCFASWRLGSFSIIFLRLSGGKVTSTLLASAIL